jgi:transposase
LVENLFIPVGTLLQMTSVTITAEQVTAELVATASAMPCPRCQCQARRIHSRYQRTLADLPIVQRLVRLVLQVRRFFCDNPACPQRTFCERLPELAAAHARRTKRLSTEQRHLALDIGGEAGARLAQRQGMPISPATLLRLARRDPPPAAPTPRVLGVDDFSLRKGQVFGTILVDLERHQPIDLLPDRSSDSLAAWLQSHPGVKVISRDRSVEYADGATRGAPNAVQVADRFHLLQNLREALQRVLEQHVAAIQSAQMPTAEASSLPETVPSASSEHLTDNLYVDVALPEAPQTQRKQRQTASRARRQERYTTVRELHAQGVSIHMIARQTDMSRQTIRRFLRADQFPEHGERRQRRRKLDPFVPFLREQLAAGNDNGAALWRLLRDQHSYTGSRSQVTQWVADHRQLCPVPSPTAQSRRGRPPASQASTPPAPRRRSARQVSWLLIRPFKDLEAEEQQLLERLTQRCSEIEVAYTLGQSFITMVKTQDHAVFDQWLQDADQSGNDELRSFAAGLERDGAAVRAALQLPYSNGQVEGQVNRLKLIKRMAYGRAKFDLLRQRVLAA